MSSKLYAAFAFFAFSAAAFAQPDLHACRASPEFRDIYDGAKTSNDTVPTLRAALKEHPDSLFLNQMLLTAPGVKPGSLAAEYKQKFESHPGEPLYMYLYGQALIGADSAKAIELLKETLVKDPHVVQAHEALMSIYSYVAFDDRDKLTESMKLYYEQCPDDIGMNRYINYVNDPNDMRELTAKLRKAVDKYPYAGVAGAYPNLWRAEARVNGANNPEQIRKDMARIRELDPDNKNNSKSLVQGYRLLGDSTAAAALEGKQTTTRAFPAETSAWFRTHGQSAEATASDEFLAVTEKWLKDYPDEPAARLYRFQAVSANPRATTEQIAQAGAALISAPVRRPPNAVTPTGPPNALQVLEVWVARSIRLKDCAALAQQIRADLDKPQEAADDRMRSGPNVMMGGGSPLEPNFTYSRTQTYTLEIEADRKQKDFAAAHATLAEMNKWIDSNRAFSGGPRNSYHLAAAALAEAEGKPQDALDHYKQTWRDEACAARARAVWASMGRKPEGFESWWKE